MLRELRENDGKAWAKLYEANANSIYRYAHARCSGDVHAAEEIVQQVFMTAIDKVGTFSGGEDKLTNWLFGIAKIETVRRFGRKDRILDNALSLDEFDAEAMIADGNAGIAPEAEVGDMLIDRTIAAIPEAQGKMLLYKYCEGLSVNDIASMTGRTVKAIESLLSRGRNSFRKHYCRLKTQELREGGAE